MAHHYLTIVLCGVIVTIPDGGYDFLVFKFLWYSVYNNFVSLLQFNYQKSAIYSLKAVGKRTEDMDVTMDTGISLALAKFISLKVLLPFLFAGYSFQFGLGFYLLQHILNNTSTIKW